MNAYNVCSFIGHVPTAEVFKPVFVAGDETKRARYNATLAVRRDRKKEGERYYYEDLVRFTAWGATAEYLNKYAPPGTTIAIVGSLNVDTVSDQNGNKRTFYTIVVDNARIVGSSNTTNNQQQESTQEDSQPSIAEVKNPFQKKKQEAEAAAATEQHDTTTTEDSSSRFNPFGKNKG